MGMTFAGVDAFARTLPGVSTGARWGNRTWLVGERGFIWERPFSKADLQRFGDTPPPVGDILGVWVGDLDAKDAVLAMERPGFFTIEHFKNYPAFLIALKTARAADVRAAIAEAHRVASTMPPPKRRRKPATKSTPKKRAR